MSIESKLIEVLSAKQNIKDAILRKNPTIYPSGILSSWGESIDSIPSGSQFRSSQNVVDFVNHNGTVLYSYTKTQANALTEMPPLQNASTRLRAVRWNFTLDQMKLQLSKYGKCMVGAVYMTNDGQTWIDGNRLNGFYPTLRFKYKGTGGTNTRIICKKGASESGYVLYDQTFEGNNTYSTKILGMESWIGSLGRMRVQVSSDHPGSVHLGEYLTGLSTNTSTSRFSAEASLYQNMFMGNNIDNEIGDNVFNLFTSLSSVTLPPQISSIGDFSFRRTRLTHLTIPNGVTSIGDGAFAHSYNLKSISIPESVSSIGASAFMNCESLENINLPTGLKRIEGYTFANCKSLKKITIPDQVSAIGAQAFYETAIEEISIPSIVKAIGTSAFMECRALKKAELPSQLSSAPRCIFYNCLNLMSALHYNTTLYGTVGPSAYLGCNNMEVWIHGQRISSIQDNAFRGCNSLQYFEAPMYLKSIGEYAFYGTYGVQRYDFTNCQQIPTLANSNAFVSNKTQRIYVPSDLYTNWRKAANWKNLSTMIYTE